MVDYENFYGNSVKVAANVTQEFLDEHEDMKCRLRPTCAVKIVMEYNDCYMMQLRDLNPEIPLPGMIEFFGGAVERDEDRFVAAMREIREELPGIVVSRLEYVQLSGHMHIFRCNVKKLPESVLEGSIVFVKKSNICNILLPGYVRNILQQLK